MDSRQRILTALSHKEPDRCPTYTWMAEHTEAKLMRHLHIEGREELENALGIDRWRQVELRVEKTEMKEERIRKLISADFIKELESDDVSINGLGCVVKNHANARYLEDVIRYPLQDVREPSEVDEYPFDVPESIAAGDENVEEIRKLKKRDAVVTASVAQPFKTACGIRGMENTLCDFLINGKVIERIYDQLYDFSTAYCVALAKVGVDIVKIVGDIAMQDRLMMSPDVWRQYDKPRLARLISEMKQANSNTFVYMHTDGKVSEIIPDLVEIGLDILNPIQPECQDPIEVKKTWGDRLVLHGAVSNQRSVPLGTPQTVKEEVWRLLDHCGVGGGFVIGPSNVLIPEFPLENIIAMYAAVSEYYN